MAISDFRFSVDQLVHVRQGLAVASGLTLLAGFTVPLISRVNRPAAAASSAPTTASDSSAAVSLADDWAAIRNKSLFRGSGSEVVQAMPARVSTRAPRVAPTATPAAPPPVRLADLAADYQVTGILNDGSEAVVTHKKTGETVYVTAGQHIGNMSVTAVNASGISLSYDGQTMNLAL